LTYQKYNILKENFYKLYKKKENCSKANENSDITMCTVINIMKSTNNSSLDPSSNLSNYSFEDNLPLIKYIYLAEFINNLDENFASDLVEILGK